MIDLRYLKKLIEMLDESSVDSIEISSDKGMKIRLSKSPSQRGVVGVGAPIAVPAVAAPVVPATLAAENAAAAAAAAPRAEEPRSTLLEVKSPMVGTYYSAPEPGAPPFVAVGERVSRGQTLCIIEAMKIMNEIESEYDGIVRELLVDNAQPVEYGQVLLRVDPTG